MLNCNPYSDAVVAVDMSKFKVSSSPVERPDCRFSSGQLLTPLHHTMASWHRRYRRGGNEVIIRFLNGYGAIISEYRLMEGIYEIAAIRFHGPEADDFEFYFRSHVPDLTWCSDDHEMVRVCEQISHLLPPATV